MTSPSSSFDLGSGVFTAPTAGTYRFEFQGMTGYNGGVDVEEVALVVNGAVAAARKADEINVADVGDFSVVLGLSRTLAAGDAVWFRVSQGYLQCSGVYLCTFTGSLLY